MSSFVDSVNQPAANPTTTNNNNNATPDTNGYHQNGITNENDNNDAVTNGVVANVVDDELLELRFVIDGTHVGAIIGKSGSTVKHIREDSGAFVSIHQKDGRASERIMTVKGTHQQQVRAAELLSQALIDAYKEKRDALLGAPNGIMNRDRELAHGTNDTTTLLRLLVHKSHVGAVIGRGGVAIKEIQAQTNAKIQVSNDALPMSTEKSISFSGTPQAISAAMHSALIEMKNNPMKPNVKMTYYQPGNALFQQTPTALTPFAAAAAAATGSPFINPSLLLASQTLGFASAAAAATQQQSQRIAIPTVCAGLVIGKGGQTIKGLRTQSGCHIQIADPEMNSPNERVVTITGTQPGINQAILLIRQLVERYVPPTLTNGAMGF